MEMKHPAEVLETEAVPDKHIAAFYITARDKNKAVRVRKMLSKDAPGTAGKAIFHTPIQVKPLIQKNRMYAVDDMGDPVLVINLKSGAIEFTNDFDQYPLKRNPHR